MCVGGPDFLNAAWARLGQGSDSKVITAALEVLRGGDDFGPWLVSQAGALPDDFELEFRDHGAPAS
jgi:hypothetical protein